MKVYTKTGDKGTTALFGGTRVDKHHLRIDCYGTIDELNSYLGLIRDQNIDARYKDLLSQIQHNLFTLGATLATDPEKAVLKSGKKRLDIITIQESDCQLLENEIDEMETTLEPMTHFVLPGGHQTVSFCHIARCVCRRGERLISALNSVEPVDSLILSYVNRLSDYLFVLARKLTKDLQAEEIKWIPKKQS
jgi:cob(I)alamin adenosyltransferase